MVYKLLQVFRFLHQYVCMASFVNVCLIEYYQINVARHVRSR